MRDETAGGALEPLPVSVTDRTAAMTALRGRGGIDEEDGHPGPSRPGFDHLLNPEERADRVTQLLPGTAREEPLELDAAGKPAGDANNLARNRQADRLLDGPEPVPKPDKLTAVASADELPGMERREG